MNNNKYQDFAALKVYCQAAVVEFQALKVKYQATQYPDSHALSPLFAILKQLDVQEPLSIQQIEWLQSQQLPEIFAVFVQQEHSRNLQFTALKEKYQAGGYADTSYLSRPLYEILQLLDTNKPVSKEEGKRLDEIEATWLHDKFQDESYLLIRYHQVEASFYENEYKNTGNKWNLANASSHWRKAEKPKSALAVTDELNFAKIQEDKLKSALLTTRGGAFRDLEELEQAENCAKQAIQYHPQSHHPYTLMGAICFERGQYPEGEKWFEKAIQRGASPRDQDAELKRIVRDTKDSKKRRELIDYLLKKDSRRYSWAKEYLHPRKQ